MEKIKELYFKYKEVINYLFFGGCTFLVNMITFFVCNKLLSFNEHIANLIAWIVAVFFAYITNRKFVFESKVETKQGFIKEMLSFFGARLLTLLIEEVIIFVGCDLLSIDSMIVKVIGQVVVILSNYVLSKLFVFKK